VIPWAKVYKNLSLAYGWTPQEINKMTLYQIAMYSGVIVPEMGTIELDGNVSQAEIEAMLPWLARRRGMPSWS